MSLNKEPRETFVGKFILTLGVILLLWAVLLALWPGDEVYGIMALMVGGSFAFLGAAFIVMGAENA